MPSSNPELRKKHRKDYYDRVMNDPVRHERRKQTNARIRKRLKESSPKKFLVYSARERARKYNLECEITEHDFEIPELCPVLGIPLRVSKDYAQPDSPSLDRINPKKGYVKGNIAVMSHRANRIKGDATIQELEAVIKFLNNHMQA